MRDAWIAGRFGPATKASKVRLVAGNWPDFEIEDIGGGTHAFEAVEADIPNRRRGDDYAEAAELLRRGESTAEHVPIETIHERNDQVAPALAAAAENKAAKRYQGRLPTIPMNDKQLSARVCDLMQMENRAGQIGFFQAVQAIDGFESYLRKQQSELSSHPGYSNRVQSGSSYILTKIQEALAFARRENARVTGQPDLLDV